MRIGAHRAKEPQILGESGEIAFKRTLHLEIIRLSRFIANFAGQLRDLFHIGLNDSDGFAAGEDSRGQFFNHRSLKRFGDRGNRHFAAHLQNFCCFVILTSYSLYVDTMEKWFNAEVESDWTELRARLMRLLQEESELNEIVQLVGMDALSAPDRLKLEAARSIREDFLHQNAFHEIDTFTSLKKQHMMMMLMLAYYDKAGEALAQGVNIERLVGLPVREAIGRFKYTEEADLDKVYEDVIKTLESEINSELSRKEDF